MAGIVPLPAATAGPTHPEVHVGGEFTLGRLSEGVVLGLAAVTCVGSQDPVDQALAVAVAKDRPDLEKPQVDSADFDPASPKHRYSLTMVRYFPLEGDDRSDVVVMRGSLEAVMAETNVSRKDKGLLRRNAVWAQAHGWRPLAVATAPVTGRDQVGPFTMQGFVYIGIGPTKPLPNSGPSNWAWVQVWSASLRVQHWINVAAVFTLSCTGYIIMDPFFGPAGGQSADVGFQMGWVRMVHFTVGFLWIVLGLTRVVAAFTSRDRHQRWNEWWPLKSKQDVKYLGEVLGHYALIKNHAPLFLGHNPLQQLTYTAVYLACGVQMFTGLTLFGLYHQTNWFWELMATPAHWVGIPFIRLFHTMMMFCLWAFVIVHVYLAVRADSLERHGGISSMINGGVWLRQGAKPVDAPEIG
ncbi:MAG: Ni/Fe-hydrogenase, b-type cytochrome subunit [Bifidobacteriaceae bacterium]|jgi:Ni/Fe-hydrogenase b-type cytochrome subunit|nr:Ni/Fe-hydrogenase, b-type cytochrome subunit [Bifidobacteriaceae bacterium]